MALIRSSNLTILLTLTLTLFLHQSHASNKRSSSTQSPSMSPIQSPKKKPSPSPKTPLSHYHNGDEDGDEEELTLEYENFILACQKIMTKKCADEIVGNIYQDTKVSKTCCSHLVNMGPDCHSELLEREKSLPKSEKEKQKIVRKSEGLLKKCEQEVGPVKGKKYPKLPERWYRPRYENFLRKCVEKVTEKCGTEVVQAIFGKDKDATKVDKKCCGRLLHMGEECHVEMVRRLKELPKNKGKKEREMVQKRSDMVWKQCKQIAK